MYVWKGKKLDMADAGLGSSIRCTIMVEALCNELLLISLLQKRFPAVL